MINIRKSQDRGHANHGWLDTHHTFSFANYYDSNHIGFSVLRVINEDHISGGMGFDLHPHYNMEIITYIVKGSLEHRDSMGNSTIILPGDIQRMSAGTGVRHSEFNHLKDSETHLLQIWILPEKNNIVPSYEQKSFLEELSKNDMILVATKDGKNGSISLNQDVNIYAGKSHGASGTKKITTSPHRHFWLQVIAGEVTVEVKNEQQKLEAGDGAGISEVENLDLSWGKNTEFLLFDLP